MDKGQLTECIFCGSKNLLEKDPLASLVQCAACEGVFDNPRPTEKEIEDFYSRFDQYDGWLENLSARDQLWKRRLTKLLPDASPGSLLDVGAGIGQFLSIARGHFKSVHGTELSDSAIENGKKLFGIEILKGTLETTNFLRKNFSTITLFHVLEHLPFPKEAMQICYERLEPLGRVFIAVPNDIASLGAKLRQLRYRLGSRKNRGKFGLPRLNLQGGIDEVHLSHFTEASLKRLLEGVGFKIIKMDLDPFFAEEGIPLLKHQIRFFVFKWIHWVTGRNLYGTIWAVAEKGAHGP